MRFAFNDLTRTAAFVFEPLPWLDDAACARPGVDRNLFFAKQPEGMQEALGICRSCEARPQCLNYALENGERWGVWGGVTAKDRRRMRRPARPRLCAMCDKPFQRKGPTQMYCSPVCTHRAAQVRYLQRRGGV